MLIMNKAENKIAEKVDKTMKMVKDVKWTDSTYILFVMSI